MLLHSRYAHLLVYRSFYSLIKFFNQVDSIFYQNAYIFCLTGVPEPEVKWYKGEEKLKPKKSDKRLKISYDSAAELHTVVISSATVSDTAKYTVKAVNQYGSVKASVKVEVQKVSEEKKVLAEVSVTVDESVREETEIHERVESKEETGLDITVQRVPGPDGTEVDVENKFVIAEKLPVADGDVDGSLSLKLKKPAEDEGTKGFVSKAVDENLEKTVVEIKSTSDTVSKNLLEAAEVRVDKSKRGESIGERETDESELNKERRVVGTVKVEPDKETLLSKTPLKESPEVAFTEATPAQSVPDSELEKVVGIAPSFVIKPQSVAVVEGDTIRLQCKVKG